MTLHSGFTAWVNESGRLLHTGGNAIFEAIDGTMGFFFAIIATY